MKALRRFDRGLARGEAALASGVLILMILVAAAQALLRNLTNWDVGWANVALEHMDWGDSFMQKCTLWLAFLGASLSTYDEKHIGIDVLHRIVKPRTAQLLRTIVSAFAGVTCFYLSRVFWLSVLNNAKEVPLEYSVLSGTDEMVHLCEAAPQILTNAELTKPTLFCMLREFLAMFGADMSTPDIALQLIVPTMFLFMALRFVLRAAAAARAVVTNQMPEPAGH